MCKHCTCLTQAHSCVHTCVHTPWQRRRRRRRRRKKRGPDNISEEFARWPFVWVFVGWNERGRGFKAMCIKCALAWKSIPDGTQIAAVQTLPLTPASPTLPRSCPFLFICTPLNTQKPQKPYSDCTHTETNTDKSAPHRHGQSTNTCGEHISGHTGTEHNSKI